MKSQRDVFKWTGLIFLFVAVMSFMFFLPSAFAQEGNPTTPTPVEPLATPEPFLIPGFEQENGVQSQGLVSPQTSAVLGGNWSAYANISESV